RRASAAAAYSKSRSSRPGETLSSLPAITRLRRVAQDKQNKGRPVGERRVIRDARTPHAFPRAGLGSPHWLVEATLWVRVRFGNTTARPEVPHDDRRGTTAVFNDGRRA